MVQVLSVSNALLVWVAIKRPGLGCINCGARWSDQGETVFTVLLKLMKLMSEVRRKGESEVEVPNAKKSLLLLLKSTTLKGMGG